MRRAFSTCSKKFQQKLFEPYQPPLNERQKKSLRKIARQDEPQYHGNMNKDALWMLTACRRSDDQRALLGQTLKRLRAIIQKLGGPNFNVIDISMHTYASHIHDAPFEFAITDSSRPNGVPPTEHPLSHPLYDPHRVSEILQEEGFQGGYWVPPWDMGKLPFHNHDPPKTPSPRSLTLPWSDPYCRSAIRQLLYPAKLITSSPVAFSLTLPGPSVTRLHDLISTYFNLKSSYMRPLMDLLFIWTRSHRMDEFTTTCLALMLIRYMQEQDKLRNILGPARDTSTKDEFWVPLYRRGPNEWTVESIPLTYQIPNSEIPPKQFDKKPGGPLWNFLMLWKSAHLISSTYILSAGSSKYLARQVPLLRESQRERDLPEVFAGLEAKAKEIAGYDPAKEGFDEGVQNVGWGMQQLVVQDPFLPTYNHAEAVSRETISVFARHAQDSQRNLAYGWPFLSIFGDHYRPSDSKKGHLFEAKHKNALERLGMPRFYHVNAIHRTRTFTMDLGAAPEPVMNGARKGKNRSVLGARNATIDRINRAVQRKYGDKYIVRAFGSTEYGVSGEKSDLDLVIVDKTRSNGFELEADPLPEIYQIKKLAKVFRSAGFKKVTPVAATVPIIKFIDSQTRFACDINVNEQLGLRNTGMIKRYCDVVPILRPMVWSLKRWAKGLGMNDPSGYRGVVTFSSYALMLMTISFLQSRGMAPNLQAFDHPKETYATTFWTRRKLRGGFINIPCDTKYHLACGWTPDKEMSVEEALVAWFRYWATEHSYGNELASIKLGGFCRTLDDVDRRPCDQTPLAQVPTAQQGSNRELETAAVQADGDVLPLPSPSHSNPVRSMKLLVIDPFILSKVVTGNIDPGQVQKFQANCAQTIKMLGWGGSLEEVIASPGKTRRGESVLEETTSIVPPPRRMDLCYLNSLTSFQSAHAKEYPGAVALDSSAILPDDPVEFGFKSSETLVTEALKEVVTAEEEQKLPPSPDDGRSGHFGFKSASTDVENFVREYERARGSG